ncbi:MAG: DUF503 domain-containing protein [Myxococcota bacterium]|jgi:hypothetical protein|nr:DUF503 domain-containing protein [Myxococcota bacterium]
MVVGAAVVEIHVYDSQSLKQKRGVVRSIQQRLRNQFNISVSEVGGQGTWQRAVLGMSAAGAEAPPVKKVLERAIHFVEERHDCEVLDSDLEIMVLPHEASAPGDPEDDIAPFDSPDPPDPIDS